MQLKVFILMTPAHTFMQSEKQMEQSSSWWLRNDSVSDQVFEGHLQVFVAAAFVIIKLWLFWLV